VTPAESPETRKRAAAPQTFGLPVYYYDCLDAGGPTISMEYAEAGVEYFCNAYAGVSFTSPLLSSL
jgi:hypothetical protein